MITCLCYHLSSSVWTWLLKPRLDVGKLKDERGGEEVVNRLSRDLGGLGALGNPE